jgi:predicted transposase/invertase (TIGR01784 family)
LSETTNDVELGHELESALESVRKLIGEGGYLFQGKMGDIDNSSLGAFKMLKGVMDKVYFSDKEPEKRIAFQLLKEKVDAVVIPRSGEEDTLAKKILSKIIKGKYLIPEILSPCEDGVFKAFLAHTHNLRVQTSFLESYLRYPIYNLAVSSNEPMISSVKEKRNRYDVNFSFMGQDHPTQLDAEMNRSVMIGDSGNNRFEIMRDRIAFTLAQLHASQRSQGVDYPSLKRTIHLNFCNFKVWNNAKLINVFSLKEEDGEELNSDMIAMTVELPKIKGALEKPVSRMTDAEMWTLFLACADNPKYRKLISELAETKEEIRLAVDLIGRISADENERARYLSRLIADMDYVSDITAAEEKGVEKGVEKGKEEDAINMLSLGIEDDIVMKVTGFDSVAVKKLREKVAQG